ncbi:uncharacterized protein [Venturia canescens]|uniref:uncharacterized protein isoform X2 n=1 Tax=Venturia canescens TaxID=32260 RepID=UPI001C9D37C8|nr:uncharacterized protein LOC122418323 isoform X2 [Venturia canescens]
MTSNKSIEYSPWLIPDLIQNILRQSENDERIKVRSVTSKPATADGDNYMSDISRVSIEFTRSRTDDGATEMKTLIFKVSLKKDRAACDLAKKFESFETEIQMMQNTMAKMNEILNENDYRLNARVFHARLEEPSFLVLEDLVARGFHLADKQTGLDLDHCMLLMRGLAKFHASSIAVYEKDPSCIKRHRKGMYNKECPEEMQSIFKEAFKALSVEVKNWPELDPIYSQKLLQLSEVCIDKGVKCSECRENEFNVLNHGDAWINNLMFRYDDEGKVDNQIFLDFQICSWTCPAFDLVISLSSVPNDDVYIHHFDLLVAEYSKTLTNTMLRINCETKPPTLSSIRQWMKEREFLAVLDSVVWKPFTFVDKSEVVDMSDLVTSEGTTSSPGIKDERYRQIITRRLKDWNSRGLLDI